MTDSLEFEQRYSSGVIAWATEDEPSEVLWLLASQAMKRPINEIDEYLFHQCCQVFKVGIRKLTISLFWINLRSFLPCDKKTSSAFVAVARNTSSEQEQDQH